ncbi:MAG: tRNA lysidine(34) synthetase TilS [Candidatus Moranbacteria bacterium]|nr:tRNA lysidine(34) synthetase TilS [Candidatus Moranbacteria bacterium]
MPTSSYGRTLIKRVRNNDVEYGLLARNAAILVGCSGGPDSVALLHILLALRSKLSLRLGVAHVNYGIRGVDANEDESLVRKLCVAYDIPFYTYHPRRAQGINEQILRDERYVFFRTVLRRERFDVVSVAHTRDDQAETVLIRLLRGAGPDGLSAMRPAHDHIIRPLLDITKAELLEFLSKEGIRFRVDSTNRDMTILRNRIRHELIPLLDSDYRPGIVAVLARTARILDSFPAANEHRHYLATEIIPGGVSFGVTDFLALSNADRAHELRRLYQIVSGTGLYPAESFVREVTKLIIGRKNKVRTYRSGRLKIEARGDKVAFVRTHNESSL